MANHTLLDVEAFLAVAQSGGFTPAARALGTSKSVLSRRVRRLEDSLGVQLLLRTTRRSELTDEGRIFLGALDDLDARVRTAESLVQARKEAPEGVLRVVMPSYLGGSHVTDRVIQDFMARYPDVKLDVRFSDRGPLDTPQSFDVAIMTRPKYRRLADSTLREVSLGRLPSALYAAPSYCEQNGVPSTPTELATHRCISYRTRLWRFSDAEENETEIEVDPILLAHNNEVLRAATIAGHGIVYSFQTVFRDAVERGLVVPIMAPYTATAGLDLRILLPASPYPPLRTTLFVRALRQAVTESP